METACDSPDHKVIDRRNFEWYRAVSVALQLGLGLVIAFFCCGWGYSYELIDLTRPFRNDTISWPGFPQFELDIISRGRDEQGRWAEANAFTAAEHGGTHCDAPSHFQEDKWRLHEIPLDRLFNKPAVVIDISKRALNEDRDTQLTVFDIAEWERANGVIPKHSIVILRTGWAQFYSNRTLYLGNDANNASDLHFPGFSQASAKYLSMRQIHGVGIDTPSIDRGPSTGFETHRELYQHNIIGIENLDHLDQLPVKGFKLFMFPIHIEDGSGGPCRVIAQVAMKTTFKDFKLGWIFALVLLFALSCLTVTYR